MFGWSINLFRVRGIRLSLDVTFLLFLAYICEEGWIDGGIQGLLWDGGLFLCFFVCVVLHELGHSLTGMRLGFRVRRILLTPLGGVAEFEQIPKNPGKELLITVAGPSVNFAIAALLWLAVGLPEGWDNDPSLSWVVLARTLVRWNLVMGFFNMIPAFPMDGGRILRALLALKLPYLKATYWAYVTGKVITIPGFFLALYAKQYILAGIAVFIYLAGQAEYRMLKRREEEEAYWRQMVARQVSERPPADPPILGS